MEGRGDVDFAVPGDPTTELNTRLIAFLGNHNRIFVAGQAKSHCVNHTVRDLAGGLGNSRNKIIVLDDTTSSVESFEETATQFKVDMTSMGVTFENTVDIKNTVNI